MPKLGSNIVPRSRGNRIDAAIVADFVALLIDAPKGATAYSGLVRDTKTAAGSDGYAYREALKLNVPPVLVSSVTRQVKDLAEADRPEGADPNGWTWALVRLEDAPVADAPTADADAGEDKATADAADAKPKPKVK